MLHQSNQHPPQTRQPLPSLDFADRDLTDAFADQRDQSHSSISGLGHPRGSTPISFVSSRRSTASNAFSSESPQSRRTLPNMTALLDFLEDDHPTLLLNSNHHHPNHNRTRDTPRFIQSTNPHHHRSSSSKPSTSHHPTPPPPHHLHQLDSTTPGHTIPKDLDLTSNFSKDTYEHIQHHRFRGHLPTSSTPFTNLNHSPQLEGLTPDRSSEISSPLNKRHLPNTINATTTTTTTTFNNTNGILQPNLQPLKFSNHISPPQTIVQNSPTIDPSRIVNTHHRHQVMARPISSLSDRPSGINQPSSLVSETPGPARLPNSKLPSAADRLAAAVMEGAPESHWTFLVEPERTIDDQHEIELENPVIKDMNMNTNHHHHANTNMKTNGIRRSKVVEELLQPMRPSISSCPGHNRSSNHQHHDTVILPSRSFKDDSDLPQSLIDETKRTNGVTRTPERTSEDQLEHNRPIARAGFYKSIRFSSSTPNLIRPSPQRPTSLSHNTAAINLFTNNNDVNHNPSASDQVQLLDARVNHLLSHIRSDRLEKVNLVKALTEARLEVASLREEVRLLRVGVQNLGNQKSYQSVDTCIENHHPPSSLPSQNQQQRQHQSSSAPNHQLRRQTSDSFLPKSFIPTPLILNPFDSKPANILTTTSHPKSSHRRKTHSSLFRPLRPTSPSSQDDNDDDDERGDHHHDRLKNNLVNDSDLDLYLKKRSSTTKNLLINHEGNDDLFENEKDNLKAARMNQRLKLEGSRKKEDRRKNNYLKRDCDRRVSRKNEEQEEDEDELKMEELSKRFIEELALGMSFTRCVDSLIMNPSSSMMKPFLTTKHYAHNQSHRQKIRSKKVDNATKTKTGTKIPHEDDEDNEDDDNEDDDNEHYDKNDDKIINGSNYHQHLTTPKLNSSSQVKVSSLKAHAHTQNSRTKRRKRSDSEIFDPINLDRLLSRLKVWKLLLVGSSSSTTHPNPNHDHDHDPNHPNHHSNPNPNHQSCSTTTTFNNNNNT